MQHSYNRERNMPVVIEVTFEELRLIEKVASAVLELEEMPNGIWSGELSDLCENVKAAIREVAQDAAQHFAHISEEQ